jgi:ligand-binding sensor domain-containing protein
LPIRLLQQFCSYPARGISNAPIKNVNNKGLQIFAILQSSFSAYYMQKTVQILLFFLSTACSAQQFQFTDYTIKEGLSSSNITTFVKDKNGFFWLGTSNGLNRFDGNTFDCFYNNPGDDNSLPGNEVQALWIDEKQQMWAGTVGGISLYNRERQDFTNYYPDSSNGKCGRWFCAIRSADDGKLWVGTWYELLVFDPAAKKFQRSGWADFAATHKPANGNNSRVVIMSMEKKSANEMWILTSYGLYSVNTLTRQFQWYPYSGIDDYFGCRICYADGAGNLWIGTYNKGIVCFNTRTNTWSSYLPPPDWNSVPGFNQAYAITQYSGDTLLYSGLDGLALFDAAKKKFISRIPAADFTALNIRKENSNFWITGSSGLTLMSPVQKLVTKETPFAGHNFINKAYPLLHQPKWLVLSASERNQTGVWQPEGKIFKPFMQLSGKPVGGELSGWLQINDSLAYLGVEEMLYTVNPATMRATAIALPAKQFPANKYTVRNIAADEKGNIWIRLRGQGIVKYNPVSHTAVFENFIQPSPDKAYSSMYYNKAQKCIWAGVEHEGVYQYDIITGKTVSHPLPGKNNIAADITSITGDAAGNMYLTDVMRGMYYFNESNKTFTLYSRQDGLPSNTCYFAALDSTYLPWVITAQGIVQMDVKSGKAVSLSNISILPKDVSFLSVAPDGVIYTCVGDSYYQWHTGNLPRPGTDPVIYLRKMLVNNQPVPISGNYKLGYDENNISLQVGAIVSGLQGPVDFEYMLNNSAKWLPVENGHTLNFSNLAPGAYSLTLRQKGMKPVLLLEILISPPWWKRTWFWALLIAATGSAVFLLIKKRIDTIRRQSLLKQKMAETEMMALRAQMNPHFIFNCISSIDNFILDNDKENASAWLNKFARLIRGILDNSKQEVIPFWKDWETLRLYTELEQLRANNSFTCSMDADEALLNGHYRIPPLIVQPYVENAIHHGLKHRNDSNGHLHITARLQQQQLVFTIEDNGIGRAKAAELKEFNQTPHSSYGMQLSGERVQLFNAAPGNVTITDLRDAAGNAVGTRVEVSLSV